jgi:glycerophosphoryl diester phosphodiesterase
VSASVVLWFLLLSLLAGAAWRTVLWRPRPLPGVTRQRPWLLGHRGVRPVGHSSAPSDFPFENGIEAFRQAFEAGLDGIECDVQLTSDGELVLFHDRRLEDLEVTASSFEELSSREPRLARLTELLELADGFPGTLLNIELKLYRRSGNGLERRVARLVRERGLADRVLVSSFDPLALLRLRLAAPELRTALLFAPSLPERTPERKRRAPERRAPVPGWLRTGASAGWLHADAIHPRFDQVDERMIRLARERNLMVNAWTVNEDEEVRRLVELGASGIIADDPQALKRAAGR